MGNFTLYTIPVDSQGPQSMRVFPLKLRKPRSDRIETAAQSESYTETSTTILFYPCIC